MRELLRSNDLVHLSWAQAALSAAGIESVLLDDHISSIEGNIGAFPRRLMVRDDLLERARKVLARAAQAHASG
jgi:Putative prokaryotic signal transducing protein